MSVMDPKEGDIKTIWDRNNSDEVEAARAQFKKMTDKGFLAYTVKKSGRKGDQIHEFDPDAEKIILTPPVRGG
jgi:hypothetical protein